MESQREELPHQNPLFEVLQGELQAFESRVANLQQRILSVMQNVENLK